MTEAEFMKSKRAQAHLSQSELAHKLGYATYQLISDIERGKLPIPIAKMKQYAEALKISPNEIAKLKILIFVEKLKNFL